MTVRCAIWGGIRRYACSLPTQSSFAATQQRVGGGWAAGRGALTLGTLRPLPTEPLHIPPLCLGEDQYPLCQGCCMLP